MKIICYKIGENHSIFKHFEVVKNFKIFVRNITNFIHGLTKNAIKSLGFYGDKNDAFDTTVSFSSVLSFSVW